MPGLDRHTLATATAARPGYDRESVRPGIAHIGVGGFHRAHQAAYLDSLLALDPAAAAYGLVGISLLPHDRRIVDTLTAQDFLYTLLIRDPDGTTQARVIGSIVDHRFAPDDPAAVIALLASPSIRIVTLTVTEGGYFYRPADGSVDLDAPDLVHDAAHLDNPRTAFGYLVAALQRRRAAGIAPFTVQSCDNVHGNGDVTATLVTSLARRADAELGDWVAAEVAFPNSMVDRITPRTTDADVADAEALTGLADGWPVTCESFTQWVIEDRFPAGRPAWERVGAELVADVAPYELMKLRLLNGAHQTIAYAGKLLGHTFVHEAVADPTIRRLVALFQRQATSTLTPIPGTDFAAYADTVLTRFGNPRIRDTVDRLTDQSATNVPGYVLPVVRDLLAAGEDATTGILVVACWARFLEGTNEAGEPHEVADRQAERLRALAARHDDDPTAVVAGVPAFADLVALPAFRDTYVRLLTALRRDGVRAALEAELAAEPGE